MRPLQWLRQTNGHAMPACNIPLQPTELGPRRELATKGGFPFQAVYAVKCVPKVEGSLCIHPQRSHAALSSLVVALPATWCRRFQSVMLWN